MQQNVDYRTNSPRRCYIDDDVIVLHVAYHYEIALDRCDTPEKILHWVEHLALKNWVDTRLLRNFVNTACDYHSIIIRGIPT